MWMSDRLNSRPYRLSVQIDLSSMCGSEKDQSVEERVVCSLDRYLCNLCTQLNRAFIPEYWPGDEQSIESCRLNLGSFLFLTMTQPRSEIYQVPGPLSVLHSACYIRLRGFSNNFVEPLLLFGLSVKVKIINHSRFQSLLRVVSAASLFSILSKPCTISKNDHFTNGYDEPLESRLIKRDDRSFVGKFSTMSSSIVCKLLNYNRWPSMSSGNVHRWAG